MKKLAKKATPAAIAVLRQATALFPKRKKASDGLLPSSAHINQNPNSDHNTGHAVDLTHDPKHGIDCADLYEKLKSDVRVSYLIFNGRIWSKEKGDRKYTGANKHEKHLHISIKSGGFAKDTRPWFPWLGEPKALGKVISKVSKPKKKKETPSPKENN
jgi:hypothetical protein